MSTSQTNTMVVTVTATVMDGSVVRWYSSLTSAECRDEPVVSASRNGVSVNTYLHLVPHEVMAQANEAFEILRDSYGGYRGTPELVQRMATHRRRALGASELVPVEYLKEDRDG